MKKYTIKTIASNIVYNEVVYEMVAVKLLKEYVARKGRRKIEFASTYLIATFLYTLLQTVKLWKMQKLNY